MIAEAPGRGNGGTLTIKHKTEMQFTIN